MDVAVKRYQVAANGSLGQDVATTYIEHGCVTVTNTQGYSPWSHSFALASPQHFTRSTRREGDRHRVGGDPDPGLACTGAISNQTVKHLDGTPQCHVVGIAGSAGPRR